jgi:hypothetical protein
MGIFTLYTGADRRSGLVEKGAREREGERLREAENRRALEAAQE